MSINESSFPTVSPTSPTLHDISLIRRNRRTLWLLLPNSNIWEQCRMGSPASECAGCHLQDIGNMKEKCVINGQYIVLKVLQEISLRPAQFDYSIFQEFQVGHVTVVKEDSLWHLQAKHFISNYKKLQMGKYLQPFSSVAQLFGFACTNRRLPSAGSSFVSLSLHGSPPLRRSPHSLPVTRPSTTECYSPKLYFKACYLKS